MTVKAKHKPSGNNEWGTPPEVFSWWNQIFNFQLDVCASSKNAKCERFYNKKDNGLIKAWGSRNWMNPPYGRGLIEPWVKRAYDLGQVGYLTVGLLPVSTGTQWWTKYVKSADYIFYYPHRINFLRGKKIIKGVSFDSCIVIWGLNP